MDFIPILCINVNITMDTMLKSDVNATLTLSVNEPLSSFRVTKDFSFTSEAPPVFPHWADAGCLTSILFPAQCLKSNLTNYVP